MAASLIFFAIILDICCLIQETIPAPVNIAFEKPASQSSTAWGFFGRASNAVDGNIDDAFFRGSCTHTREGFGVHWWMVDLLDVYTIRSVAITNRNDWGYDFLTDITIEVSRENPSMLPGFPRRTNAQVCLVVPHYVSRIADFPFECNAPVTGRYVRVFNEVVRPDARMSICEFKVYEDNIITKYPVPEQPNLALRKATSQSSTYDDDIPEFAVDGSTDGFADHNSCAHTDPVYSIHWWMVDLEENYIVQIIRITNRNDCCIDRLGNFVIEVSEKDPSTLQGFPGRTNASVCVTVQGFVPIPAPVNYECDRPVTGRYVRLFNGGVMINMCEFEVYGSKPLITTEPPKQLENGRNGQWVFVHVTSYGFQNTSYIFKSEQGFLTDCARKRLGDKENMMKAPYIQIDLPVGTCRFLENLLQTKRSESLKWTVYELVRS